jgi:hypothetical protein
MPRSPAMNVNMGGIAPPSRPTPSQSSPDQPEPLSKNSSLSNRVIWILVLFASMPALAALPLSKLSSPGRYIGCWFHDIFGNTGITMVSASMAITAIFDIMGNKRIFNAPLGLLFILVIFCYTEYGIAMVKGPEIDVNFLAVFNVIVFSLMVILVLFVFDFLSDFLKGLSNAFKKRSL